MTIESSELFELCKQVYKATGWGRMDNGSPTDEYYAANPVSILLNKPDVIKGWQIWRWEDFGESGRLHFSLGKGQAYPLYTSDYLLEKLPFQTKYTRGDGRIAKGWCYLVLTYADNGQSVATYANRNKEWIEPFYSDTPLKALLKLTLKLHENKVL